MRHIRHGRVRRGAFTLVELLVVILIIAVLVSLTAAGVMKIFYKGPELKTSSEIRQLELAIQQAEGELGVNYLPSYIVLREDNQYYVGGNPASGVLPRYQKTVPFLQRVFGKNINLTPTTAPQPVTKLNINGPGIDWNGDGIIDGQDHILEGHHCLVFWLGGIPSPASSGGANTCLGFSTNPQNPAANPLAVGLSATIGTRKGPYFTQFESARLVYDKSARTGGFFYYLQAWPARTIGGPQLPYAYFSAYGASNGYLVNSWGLYDQKLFPNPLLGVGDCPSLLWPESPKPPQALQPYTLGTTGFANPTTHQIIAPGKDQDFGSGGLWTGALGGAPTEQDKDNQANFARGILDAGQ